MMRRLMLIMMLAAAMTACKRETPPDTAASDAARVFYGHLLAGNYAAFVDGMHFADSIPGEYREQLVVNTKMFVANQREMHGGLVSADVLRQERDSIAPEANVFVLLTYKDSTKEEIVVPMVLSGDEWLMR